MLHCQACMLGAPQATQRCLVAERPLLCGKLKAACGI